MIWKRSARPWSAHLRRLSGRVRKKDSSHFSSPNCPRRNEEAGKKVIYDVRKDLGTIHTVGTGKDVPYFHYRQRSSLAMITFSISLVPSPISTSLASRS